MRKILLFCVLIFGFIACKQKENKPENNISEKQIEEISKAEKGLEELSLTHHAADFKSHQAIRFQTKSSIDKPDLRITIRTDLNSFINQSEDSMYLYYDVNYFYSTEENLDKQHLQQMLLTIYYISLPYHIENFTEKAIQQKEKDSLLNSAFNSLELQLKENPFLTIKENKIKTFADPSTNFLTAVKYFTPEEEEEIIVYQNYFSIGKILFAKYWEFYSADKSQKENPISTEKITLSRVNFFTPQEEHFKIPKDVHKVEIVR